MGSQHKTVRENHEGGHTHQTSHSLFHFTHRKKIDYTGVVSATTTPTQVATTHELSYHHIEKICFISAADGGPLDTASLRPPPMAGTVDQIHLIVARTSRAVWGGRMSGTGAFWDWHLIRDLMPQ